MAVDRGVFWYGQENFHYFDGNTVRTLKCDVHDYVFGDPVNLCSKRIVPEANVAIRTRSNRSEAVGEFFGASVLFVHYNYWSGFRSVEDVSICVLEVSKLQQSRS